MKKSSFFFQSCICELRLFDLQALLGNIVSFWERSLRAAPREITFLVFEVLLWSGRGDVVVQRRERYVAQERCLRRRGTGTHAVGVFREELTSTQGKFTVKIY